MQAKYRLHDGNRQLQSSAHTALAVRSEPRLAACTCKQGSGAPAPMLQRVTVFLAVSKLVSPPHTMSLWPVVTARSTLGWLVRLTVLFAVRCGIA